MAQLRSKWRQLEGDLQGCSVIELVARQWTSKLGQKKTVWHSCVDEEEALASASTVTALVLALQCAWLSVWLLLKA